MKFKNVHDFLSDPQYGYTNNIEELYERSKQLNLDFSKKKIQEGVDNMKSNQVLKDTKKTKKFNTIWANYPTEQYYMDVMVVNRFNNPNYKYILNVVDTHSRYVMSKALTRVTVNQEKYKDAKLFDAVKNIFEDMGTPRVLFCDNQFSTNRFNEYFKENHIDVVFSHPDDTIKNSLVERFNRTLSTMLKKWMLENNTNQWQKVLDIMVKNYNNKNHSTINAKPVDVFYSLDINRQEINRMNDNLKIGDNVRYKMKRNTFHKGDDLKFSKDIYEITDRKGLKWKLGKTENESTLPRQHYFMEYDLLKVTIPKKNVKIKEPKKAKVGQKALDRELKNLDIDGKRNPIRKSKRIQQIKKN